MEAPHASIVLFSGAALTYGAEVHKLEGVDVRITSREKTVADCYRRRRVARVMRPYLEALA